MSVVGARNIASGTYVPFRGVDRAVSPVATFSIDGTVTGDAGGGNATITMNMEYLEFGFHALFVPTRIATVDELATPEQVRLRYRREGNERLEAHIDQTVLGVAGVGSENHADFDRLGIIIEPTRLGDIVLEVQWITNEDGDTYHMHMFGLMYDAEAMARAKSPGSTIDALLSGIR